MQQTIQMYEASYDRYLSTMELPREALFITDVDLWPIYLESFTDPANRQYHNCHACKAFIRKYGVLVVIDPETGVATSAVWKPEDAPDEYVNAVAAMKNAVEKASVVGIFFSSEKTLGTPIAGGWTHYAVKNPNVFSKSFLTAGQKAAERKEDYRNVSRAIGTFNIGTLEQVVELLQTDALYRSEKVLGQAEWLFKLKGLSSTSKHQLRKKNIIWKAVADAPSGFCHPRSSMIGTLLDDLDNGMTFDVAARRFKDKMHPLQYQRPSAKPTAGAILAAEMRVKELGVERSLDRRFAMMSDIKTIWTPTIENKGNGGVFDHLKGDAVNTVAAVAGKITWVKFLSEVLPKAKKIEVMVPSGHSNYTAFVSAVHDDAPIIFQWDNPVSWYHWYGGSTASQYCLDPGWAPVKAVCLPPYMWGEKNLTHFKNDVAFIIDGTRETRNVGNALFPETLKSEFHSIRGVIEAHSRRTNIVEIDESHVIGKGLGSTVRVHTSVVTQYEVDRWD